MSKVEVKQIPYTIFTILVKTTNKDFVRYGRHSIITYLPCAVLPSKTKAKDVYVVKKQRGN